MKLSLIINTEHAWRNSVKHGLLLAQAMTNQGHTLTGVFFYGQSVKVCCDTSLTAQWLAWQKEQTCELLLCRTMLQQHHINVPKPTPFKAIGMATWVTAMEQAEKTVEVG